MREFHLGIELDVHRRPCHYQKLLAFFDYLLHEVRHFHHPTSLILHLRREPPLLHFLLDPQSIEENHNRRRFPLVQ